MAKGPTPTPEVNAREDVEYSLDRKPYSAEPAESPQYQIIEIMKNGKMVQVKVPLQEQLSASQHDPSSPVKMPGSMQGMTNLQRKKLANKTKMLEIGKK